MVQSGQGGWSADRKNHNEVCLQSLWEYLQERDPRGRQLRNVSGGGDTQMKTTSETSSTASNYGTQEIFPMTMNDGRPPCDDCGHRRADIRSGGLFYCTECWKTYDK